MREAQLNGRAIEIPDMISFAFNPMRVKVSTQRVVSIELTDGEKTFTDEREPIGGNVSIDLALYTRSFFTIDRKEMILPKEVTCTVREGGVGTTFTMLVVWGAMNVGERFNKPRKVTWFKNFPFTFNLYVPEGATARTRYDKNTYTPVTLQEGWNVINPNDLFDAAEFGVIRMDDYVHPSVWEYTFDETFRGVDEGTHISRLVVDECTKGIYLRWIDRHGYYQYYLFKGGDDVYQSKAQGDDVNVDYSSWYNFGNIQVQQHKQMTNSIRACATLVDEETFNMLLGIHSSPMVDMWYDNDWLPIRVGDATITKSGKPLQDVEIEIMMPNIVSQRL